MHIVVTKNIFIDAFRSCCPDNFNYAGLCALFDYLDDMDEQDIELDVIAICCEFSQYTEETGMQVYRMESMEELEENTTVIRCYDNTIIIQDF